MNNTSSAFYLIIGLGRSGLSTARWMKAQGIPYSAWDDTSSVRTSIALSEKITMRDPLEEDFPWENVKGIILSPGIAHHYPTPHPIIQSAHHWSQTHHHPIEMISDLELFIRTYPVRYIAITGTNGKSTTTALVAHMLEKAHIPTSIGGNFGIPVFDLPLLPAHGLYVFEFSSYQLELTPSLAPEVSILLNITPDHLDRHGGWEGYINAKMKIIPPSPSAIVIGIDSPPTSHIYDTLKKECRHTLWSVSIESQEGDFYRKDSDLFQKNDKKPFLSLKDLTLRGTHNAQNIGAAIAVLKALNVRDDLIVEGIKTFPGLVHRQEFVAKIGEVAFINDSKATNVDATRHALAAYDHIYWILGGRAKEDNLLDLKAYFPKIHKVFLIGEAMDRFSKELEGHLPYVRSGSLEEAVSHAFREARQDLSSFSSYTPHVLLSDAMYDERDLCSMSSATL